VREADESCGVRTGSEDCDFTSVIFFRESELL